MSIQGEIKLKKIGFDKVRLNSGLWKTFQKRNEETTIYAVKDRFEETGRFEAFSCDWKEGKDKKPHFFWDSDVAKWIEGTAYSMINGKNREQEAFIDSIVDMIEKNRHSDGYFNIYYTVCEKGKRWTERYNHELYCAGHLIEAAIAYKKATGKDKFLKLMCDYADCIYNTFVIENSAAFMTPGHEEIELALVKLYEETEEPRYLALAEFFIDKRGNNDKDLKEEKGYNCLYIQAHKPVREQREAAGHAVRACYLYSAMADLARINNDVALRTACESLFDDISKRKMYITGGIGSGYRSECFTAPYDLPNNEAYAETCAAISLAMFGQRMLELDVDSKYSDVVERVLYNGIISGLSLSGDAFFYENPLAYDKQVSEEYDRQMNSGGRHRTIRERAKIFGCSCCPPNINRFFAAVGEYICGCDDETVYIHQFMDCDINIENEGLKIETKYPRDGKVKITYSGARKIAVRCPEWCRKIICHVPHTIKKGYMYFENTDCLEIEFEIRPRLVRAASAVIADSGCAAVMCGPVVYCAEAVDNGDNLGDLYILKDGKINAVEGSLTELCDLEADGVRMAEQSELYADYEAEFEPCRIRLIPYFAFANRGVSEMRVWLNVKF